MSKLKELTENGCCVLEQVLPEKCFRLKNEIGSDNNQYKQTQFQNLCKFVKIWGCVSIGPLDVKEWDCPLFGRQMTTAIRQILLNDDDF